MLNWTCAPHSTEETQLLLKKQRYNRLLKSDHTTRFEQERKSSKSSKSKGSWAKSQLTPKKTAKRCSIQSRRTWANMSCGSNPIRSECRFQSLIRCRSAFTVVTRCISRFCYAFHTQIFCYAIYEHIFFHGKYQQKIIEGFDYHKHIHCWNFRINTRDY